MKKSIVYLFLLVIIASCAAKKPERRSSFMKGFSTYYNTLFNAKDALNTEIESREKNNKDNFYAPFISLVTYDDAVSAADLATDEMFKKAQENNFMGGGGSRKDDGSAPTVKPASPLEIAEAKALKAISKYSVPKKEGEKNKSIFDAHIILAQSRIYQGKPIKALEGLNYVFSKMKDDKRLPLAKIYQALAYAKMNDYVKANKLFAEIKSSDISKDYAKLLSVYYAESLLESKQKEKAIQELNNAFELNGDRKLKSRIAFLKGQIQMDLGQNEQARLSFTDAYKYANDFEFEVKSQIEIAKTFNNKSNYEGAKKYLEDIGKKGTYASRKNEFSYALGLIANKAGKPAEAQTYFAQSLTEKVSDPQIRGLTFYEIGKGHLDKNDYIHAGAYYDSAIAVMTYEPSKKNLEVQSSYIKKISRNYYLIKKNDSILSLAKMSPEQRTTFFAAHIEKLKAKEAKEELERKRAERAKGFSDGDYNSNSIFANNNGGFQDFGSSKGGFYFSNASTVSKGSANFKQTWGNRAQSDNWRYSSKTSTLDDVKNEALGITTAPNPRRYETSYYIEQIPSDFNKLDQLKKDRDTASLGMGMMYETYFGNTPLATKTLYDLVDVNPEEKVMLQSLYEIFSMNYVNNPSAAERAKQKLLSDYPYTSYAEFVRNPRNSTFIKASDEADKAYKQAFALYEQEKFEESKGIIEGALKDYPKDALVPKFALLNAFNTGKTSGKEVMILQLEQIALNYSKTEEGEKAKEMLQWLKSEIKFQPTDNKGQNITPATNGPGRPDFSPDTNQQKLQEAQRRIDEKSKNEARKQRLESNTAAEAKEFPLKKN